MRLSYELDNDDFAPAAARRAVERDLGERIDAPRLGTTRLIVSELVTNAVVHGPDAEPIGLTMELTGEGTVRGEVADSGKRTVDAGDPAPSDGENLSRLGVVAALADRWGVEEGSTRIWFELDPPAAG